MRSRSSVLAHVLGSNEGIIGHSELHKSYMNYIDLIKMRIRLYKDLKSNLKDRYLLDKILHNKNTISNKIFKIASPKVIFLLREPESTIRSTIRSTINMGNILDVESYKNPEKAMCYYCSRLLQIEKYAKAIDRGCFFLESDNLVNDTGQALNSLTRWLCLEKPLTNNYSKFHDTGKCAHGDPSDNILIGKIIKTQCNPNFTIPKDVLIKAKYSYEKCKATIMKYHA